MISQYSRPEDIDREFWQDYPKAIYWLVKNVSRREQRYKIYDDGWEVYNFRQKYSLSEPVFYVSPQTGNKWLTWITVRREADGMHYFNRAMLYQMTAAYMTVMMATVLVDEDDDGNIKRKVDGVTVYTSHMFQRMADKDRLGVDMTDRISVMRHFAEFVATGWSDTRPPRKGERHTQVMLRTPASWIRGHTTNVDQHHVTIYRTFYTDRSMTPGQLRDVRTFRKFADEKMNTKQTAIQSPDNKQNKKSND